MPMFAAKRALTGYRIAGKRKRRRHEKNWFFQRDHALFVCYAPLKNPEIVVAVIVENAGHGGAIAAPIARKILEAYFEGKKEIKAASYGAKPDGK